MKKISILLTLTASIIVLQCFASAAIANPFRVKNPNETSLYISVSAQMEYIQTDSDMLLFKAINSLPTLPRAATSSGDKATANFITVNQFADYERHKYDLKPTELVYDNMSYQLKKEQYDNLKSIFNECNISATASGTMYPQWLVSMNPSRVKNITYKLDGKKAKKIPGYTLDLSAVPSALRNVLVQANSYEKYSGSMVGKFANAVEFRLDYDTDDLHYNIIAVGDKLYVEASNKNFGCQYTLYEAEYTIDQMRHNWIYYSDSEYITGDEMGSEAVLPPTC